MSSNLWHLAGQIYCSFVKNPQRVITEKTLLDENEFVMVLEESNPGLRRAYDRCTQKNRKGIRAFIGECAPFALREYIEKNEIETDVPIIKGVPGEWLQELCSKHGAELVESHLRYSYSEDGYSQAIKSQKIIEVQSLRESIENNRELLGEAVIKSGATIAQLPTELDNTVKDIVRVPIKTIPQGGGEPVTKYLGLDDIRQKGFSSYVTAMQKVDNYYRDQAEKAEEEFRSKVESEMRVKERELLSLQNSLDRMRKGKANEINKITTQLTKQIQDLLQIAADAKPKFEAAQRLLDNLKRFKHIYILASEQSAKASERSFIHSHLNSIYTSDVEFLNTDEIVSDYITEIVLFQTVNDVFQEVETALKELAAYKNSKEQVRIEEILREVKEKVLQKKSDEWMKILSKKITEAQPDNLKFVGLVLLKSVGEIVSDIIKNPNYDEDATLCWVYSGGTATKDAMSYAPKGQSFNQGLIKNFVPSEENIRNLGKHFIDVLMSHGATLIIDHLGKIHFYYLVYLSFSKDQKGKFEVARGTSLVNPRKFIQKIAGVFSNPWTIEEESVGKGKTTITYESIFKGIRPLRATQEPDATVLTLSQISISKSLINEALFGKLWGAVKKVFGKRPSEGELNAPERGTQQLVKGVERGESWATKLWSQFHPKAQGLLKRGYSLVHVGTFSALLWWVISGKRSVELEDMLKIFTQEVKSIDVEGTFITLQSSPHITVYYAGTQDIEYSPERKPKSKEELHVRMVTNETKRVPMTWTITPGDKLEYIFIKPTEDIYCVRRITSIPPERRGLPALQRADYFQLKFTEYWPLTGANLTDFGVYVKEQLAKSKTPTWEALLTGTTDSGQSLPTAPSDAQEIEAKAQNEVKQRVEEYNDENPDDVGERSSESIVIAHQTSSLSTVQTEKKIIKAKPGSIKNLFKVDTEKAQEAGKQVVKEKKSLLPEIAKADRDVAVGLVQSTAQDGIEKGDIKAVQEIDDGAAMIEELKEQLEKDKAIEVQIQEMAKKSFELAVALAIGNIDNYNTKIFDLFDSTKVYEEWGKFGDAVEAIKTADQPTLDKFSEQCFIYGLKSPQAALSIAFLFPHLDASSEGILGYFGQKSPTEFKTFLTNLLNGVAIKEGAYFDTAIKFINEGLAYKESQKTFADALSLIGIELILKFYIYESKYVSDPIFFPTKNSYLDEVAKLKPVYGAISDDLANQLTISVLTKIKETIAKVTEESKKWLRIFYFILQTDAKYIVEQIKNLVEAQQFSWEFLSSIYNELRKTVLLSWKKQGDEDAILDELREIIPNKAMPYEKGFEESKNSPKHYKYLYEQETINKEESEAAGEEKEITSEEPESIKPSQEKLEQIGDVELPDGHVINRKDALQIVGKLLHNLGDQAEQQSQAAPESKEEEKPEEEEKEEEKEKEEEETPSEEKKEKVPAEAAKEAPPEGKPQESCLRNLCARNISRYLGYTKALSLQEGTSHITTFEKQALAKIGRNEAVAKSTVRAAMRGLRNYSLPECCGSIIQDNLVLPWLAQGKLKGAFGAALQSPIMGIYKPGEIALTLAKMASCSGAGRYLLEQIEMPSSEMMGNVSYETKPQVGSEEYDMMMGAQKLMGTEKALNAHDLGVTGNGIDVIVQALSEDSEILRILQTGGDTQALINRTVELYPDLTNEQIEEVVGELLDISPEYENAETVSEVITDERPLARIEILIRKENVAPLAVEVNYEDEDSIEYEGVMVASGNSLCEVVVDGNMKKISSSKMRMLPNKTDLNSCLAVLQKNPNKLREMAMARLSSRVEATPIVNEDKSPLPVQKKFLAVYGTHPSMVMESLVDRFRGWRSGDMVIFPTQIDSDSYKELVEQCRNEKYFVIPLFAPLHPQKSGMLCEQLEIPEGQEVEKVTTSFKDGVELLGNAKQVIIDFQGNLGKILALLAVSESGKRLRTRVEKFGEDMTEVSKHVQGVVEKFAEVYDAFVKEFPEAEQVTPTEEMATETTPVVAEEPAAPAEEIAVPAEEGGEAAPEAPVEEKPATSEEKPAPTAESISRQILQKYNIYEVFTRGHKAKLGRIILDECKGLTVEEVNEVVERLRSSVFPER